MATPPSMKKSRIEADALAQRSFASCAKEPVEETDPGECRNHAMLPIDDRCFVFYGARRGESLFMLTHARRIHLDRERRVEELGTLRWRDFTHGAQAWMCIRKQSRSVCSSARRMVNLTKNFGRMGRQRMNY